MKGGGAEQQPEATSGLEAPPFLVLGIAVSLLCAWLTRNATQVTNGARVFSKNQGMLAS